MEIELEKLGLCHQIAFAASLCERMLPLYVGTDSSERIDGFNHQTLPMLRKILDYIWDFPAVGIFEEEKLHSFLEECKEISSKIEDEDLIPQPEEYIASAPYSIADALELCLTGEIKHLEQVRQNNWFAIEFALSIIIDERTYVDDYGVMQEQKTLEEEYEIIENHYLYQREYRKEMGDYQTLIDTPSITPEFIQEFRLSADPDGLGVLDKSKLHL
jgi:uncharacterized protein